ncbi:MAG: AraC family transcriptional regulator [Nitrospirota bacterium]
MGKSIVVIATAQRRRNVLLARGEERRYPGVPSCAVEGIGMVKELLEQDCAKPLSLDQACKLSGLSRTYFCGYFKRITGLPFKSYQEHIKMERAGELLQDPDRTVADISRTLGYTTPGYFSTAFKKFTGLSPRAFRLSRKFLEES